MSTTYKLIEKVTVASPVALVTLGAGGTIPQTYTDLVIVSHVRTNLASASSDAIRLTFNGSASGYTNRRLYGDGTAAASDTAGGGSSVFGLSANGATSTANTFTTNEVYIPDYAGASHKSLSSTHAQEDNVTVAYIIVSASLWANTAAITSIALSSNTSSNFVAGCTFYLYGVSRVTPNVVATGGTVTTVGGYRYHTFTSTSSFVVSTPGTVEYLVVGGGGGGPSGSYGGGGGAGGLLSGALSVTAQTYTVTIGGGGAGSTAGSNSVFAGLTAIGGGKGNDTGGIVPAGGSGGGGAPSSFGTGATAGLGTAGQGNAGGNGTSGNSNTGGGGGAAAAGAAGSGSVGGAGGAGTSVFGTVYAGGGAGAGSSATVSTGGSGGGGNTGQPGTVNTGGGGGGSYAGGASAVGGAGGSGIVIIRYPV